MATNYSNWSKFDEEKELRTHEAKWEAESVTRDLVKKEEKLNVTLSSAQASAANAASALQSKAAVEALKAQGIACGRRRVRATLSTATDTSLPAESGLSSQDIIALSSQLSDMLLEIQTLCKFLQDKSPSYREAMENLQRLFQLQTQVSDMKTSLSKQSPDMVAPIVDSLEVNPLISKTLTAVTLAALSDGRAALAAEVARCSLKLCGDNLLMWIARGFAFASMGNVYLCNVHLRQAKRVAAELPLFAAASSFMDELEITYAHQFMKRSLDELIAHELTHTESHRVALNLEMLMDENYLVNTLRQIFFQSSNLAASNHVTALHMPENDGEVSPRGTNCSLENALCRLRTDVTMQQRPKLISELFYGAQILFLENYFRSAEVKYWSVIALLGTMNSSVTETEVYFRYIFVCCLVNIALCQLETGRYRKQVLVSEGLDILSLRQSDPVGLCKVALSIDPSLPIRLRYAFVLEKTNRPADALETLHQCRDELHADESTRASSCFADYGEGAIFTQLFIGGEMPLPTLSPMTVNEPRARDNIEAYIMNKIQKLEAVMPAKLRGKSRSQSC